MSEKKLRKVDIKKQKKHEAIIKAAIETFADKGFHNTKIKDIGHVPLS